MNCVSSALESAQRLPISLTWPSLLRVFAFENVDVSAEEKDDEVDV